MAFCSSLSFTLLLVLSIALVVRSDNCKTIKREPGRCVWYGTCADSPLVEDGRYPCYDNNLARNISSLGSDFNKLLEETCPELIEDELVCCDHSQLVLLTEQLKYPRQLFSRCPACIKNFVEHFCFTTCNPDQSIHSTPLTCIDADSKHPNQVAISDVRIYISDRYTDELYQSCSNVQYPQASNRVVDIMCGGTDNCNSTLWLNFLGDPNQNHNSPLPMHYHYGNESLPDGIKAKDRSFTPCNTSDPKNRCSCADCNTPDTCPTPPQAPNVTFPQKTVMYSVMGAGLFLSIVTFIVAIGLAIAAIIFVKNRGYVPIGKDSSGGHGKYGALDNDDSPTSSVGSINNEDVHIQDLASKPPSSTFCMPCYISGAHLENWIKIVFYHWGCFVAKYWYIVIIFGVGIVLLLIVITGVMHITSVLPFLITTDPVKLWSAPDSRARLEKNYFDDHFNPFYRTEMMIVTTNLTDYTTFQPYGVYGADDWTFGPVFDERVLEELFAVQDHLNNAVFNGTLDDGNEINVTLSDICFKPLAPDNTNCTIMSVLNYFQNDFSNLKHTEQFGQINNSYHIYYCTRDPTSPNSFYFKNKQMPCLGAFGGPVDPNVILGGFNKLPNGTPNYNNATALIVSIPVLNHKDDKDNLKAKIWEKGFLEYLKNYKGEFIEISYSAERSIEDELSRESKADIFTVALSYVLMFVYITLFLGHLRTLFTIVIDMKITIGLVGVLMVLLAVAGSICLLNLARISATLIIIEVVPFLVLAVGVDNLFIIVHSYERQVRKLADAKGGDVTSVSPSILIGRAIAEVAPSLLLTSLSETAAFLLGGISTMPAVRTFSFYAGVAVFFNFLLQVSVFLAALSLDVRRQLNNRLDILCCFKLKGFFDPRKGLTIMKTIMNGFATFLLYPVVRPFVLLLFGITTTASLTLMFKLQIGLDQRLALPKDSYLEPYFNNLYKYLHTGSPVYFVIKEGFDYSDPTMQAKFCSAAGCNKDSIGTSIFGYSRNSKLTGIAEPAMLWLDTYFEWINPASQCCGFDSDGNFCRPGGNKNCTACVSELTDKGWPKPDDFMTYLPNFLNDNPGMDCPSAGHAAFNPGVKLSSDKKSVMTSYVMTYHSIMSESSAFINGLKWARKLGDELTNSTGVTIFPYSVFYVYYEQYLTTIHDFALNIGVSVGAVFVVTFLMMGLNLWAALVIILVVCMIIVHMIGCMAISNINANAVSLVNLVMTVGIAVEFCSHTVRWFCSCPLKTRRERAHSALANMGASVVQGITFTKLIGVFVLFFAKSQLFEVYYFRMYMFMLLWGALHGLVFLPVLLSYIGPAYVPIEVVPPYEEFMPKPASLPDEKYVHDTLHPSPIPVRSKNENVDHNVQYPSLPNVDSYHPPSPDHSDTQGYPQATYPGQNQYQQRGDVYQSPNEHSQLIKP